MSIKENINIELLKKLDSSFTEELEEIREEVLEIASEIVEREVNVQSLHGFIGGKNNQYVDSIRSQFPSPKDFIGRWLKGMLDKVNRIESEQRQKYNGNVYQNTATHKIVMLLKEETVFEYFAIFLKRNFYRNLIERTRAKPNDSLWAIWFGENNIPWGLIIAPAFRKGKWTNDVSEIRRAEYMYWTIGHVLSTGLIDPDSEKTIKFSNINELIQFYTSILKRLSRSQYEKGIVDLYLNYLEKCEEPHDVPFLIPELRYAGLENKHKYRLDFSILNSHTMELVGFELSPQSSHMSIAGVKGKKQKDLNEELKTKWNKENLKRNEYFKKYNITIITFADDDLTDLNNCFNVMEIYLSKRPETSISYENQVQELNEFNFL